MTRSSKCRTDGRGDMLELDRIEDSGNICHEVEMLLHELLELCLQVEMKFGVYKLALEYRRMHHGKREECFGFCFP